MSPAPPPTVYVADTLPTRYPAEWAALRQALHMAAIPTAVFPGTRDVWLRDYMPAVLPSGGLTQFRYQPDYLQTRRGQHSLTDVASICAAQGWQPQLSALVVDGGNVVRTAKQVIMTDKVLRENAALPPRQVLQTLAEQLEVAHITLVPADPHDFTGHADGMLHFVDEHTVLVNDYHHDKSGLWPMLQLALHNARLDWIPMPYNPYRNASQTDATGIYSNFLRLEKLILLPTFELPEDEVAYKRLTQVFPDHTIVPILTQALARGGGLLHCISWVY